MAILKILAQGESQQARANARGKLFEQLMADVLRQYGYTIDEITNRNYAGMEIDIVGTHIATKVPLYAECKCHELPIDSPAIQAFHGKYITRWWKEKRCHGLFIALPVLNSHAKVFHKENCEDNQDITSKLFEEPEVLKSIYQTKSALAPEHISRLITPNEGTPGDLNLLYTDKGYFWIQYIIPLGSGISSQFAVFDGQANIISDKFTVEYLCSLWPDLKDFTYQSPQATTIIPQTLTSEQSPEEIIEVRGSSSCFEYQFPASPEHFVGRQEFLQKVDYFIRDVINEKTSCRAILFEGYSGWGKSSLVLSSAARLRDAGHVATAIDCRSAVSSQFPLRLVNHICNGLPEIKTLVFKDEQHPSVTGFEGALETILQIGQKLKADQKILAIFLDQFENIFFLPDILKQITRLLLRLCDAKSNVILGFSWKTDLVGSTSDFPYTLRDTIKESSQVLSLTTFSKPETTELLDKLSEELHARLRKDLRFFLSEFSQGYPWLLKKLCAHVKTQRDDGIPQRDIASTLLNVKDLFDEDLRGLSSQEEEILRRIAKIAPITVSEVSEVFDTNLVQNLVHRRFLVRIGPKYDLYWDIFRDYLNSGRLPIQENYILRAQLGSVIEATKLIAESKSPLSLNKVQENLGLARKSMYNIVRDMKLLGLASLVDGKLLLQVNLPTTNSAFDAALQNHIHNWLPRNRLVWRLLRELESDDSFHLDVVADILESSCPYISASEQTWTTYARVLSSWLDLADLAIYDDRDRVLTLYVPSEQVRERRYLHGRHRALIVFPLIQYSPIEKSLLRITDALFRKKPADWSGIPSSSITKSIYALEQLGFIQRKTSTMLITSKSIMFAQQPDLRPKLFAESAMNMESFRTFVDILQTHKERGATIADLARQLKQKLNLQCADSTTEIYVKIMLDWSRHANLAPGVFAKTRKGPFRSRKKRSQSAPTLFEKTENTR